MKRCLKIVAIVFAFVLLAGGLLAFRADLSALPEPGPTETFLATKAKRFVIRRASQGKIPAPPADISASLKEGDKLFGVECSECHGDSARKPTDAGRWMYPRAADLGSPEVQKYSDRELFWVVKNGIRLSGMPAFGRVEPDEHIWDLVRFVRTVPSHTNPGSQGKTH